MNQNDIDDAKRFCDAFEVEKKLREVIAGIAAKLSRSNLTVREGKGYVQQLSVAFGHLEKFEKPTE
jgi:hypothetical protein